MPRTSYGLSPEAAARLLHALGTEARVRLMLRLAGRGEASAGDLQAAVGLTQSNASHQLAVLRRAGLVGRRRDGKHVLYRLASPAAADVLQLVCGPWPAR